MYLHDRIAAYALRRGLLDPDSHDHVAVLGFGWKFYRLDRTYPHSGQRHGRAGLQSVDPLEMRLQDFRAGEELRAMADSQDREGQDPQTGRNQRTDPDSRVGGISHVRLASQQRS